jgi:LytS/YehU family sensor histidine kinase
MNGKVNKPGRSNHEGIGILNVRKRLQLLYPGKHELTITEEEEVFIVNLWLQPEMMTATKKESDAAQRYILSYHE